MHKFVDTADPFAKRLLAHYVGRRAGDVESIRQAVQDDDMELIRVAGHNMYGSGEAYGLKAISTIGKDIESAAKSCDKAGIESAVDALEQFLRELKIT